MSKKVILEHTVLVGDKPSAAVKTTKEVEKTNWARKILLLKHKAQINPNEGKNDKVSVSNTKLFENKNYVKADRPTEQFLK